MERVTISLEETLLAEFDSFIKRKGYENRSEAMRDLVRERLERDRHEEDGTGYAVACASYIYNHHQRELAGRLTRAQHEHHDLVVSTTHVHLDHDNCLEVMVLKGRAREIRRFGEATLAETGVRHGNLHLVAAEMVSGEHRHGDAEERHPHSHFSPKT
jgi:CopG family nickel-responsive transcriptional regulator